MPFSRKKRKVHATNSEGQRLVTFGFDNRPGYRWVIESPNGRVIASTTEIYTRRWNAKRAGMTLFRSA
jgi:uncharacterized protein YegP (UPF0339 family)